MPPVPTGVRETVDAAKESTHPTPKRLFARKSSRPIRLTHCRPQFGLR